MSSTYALCTRAPSPCPISTNFLPFLYATPTIRGLPHARRTTQSFQSSVTSRHAYSTSPRCRNIASLRSHNSRFGDFTSESSTSTLTPSEREKFERIFGSLAANKPPPSVQRKLNMSKHEDRIARERERERIMRTGGIGGLSAMGDKLFDDEEQGDVFDGEDVEAEILEEEDVSERRKGGRFLRMGDTPEPRGKRLEKGPAGQTLDDIFERIANEEKEASTPHTTTGRDRQRDDTPIGERVGHDAAGGTLIRKHFVASRPEVAEKPRRLRRLPLSLESTWRKAHDRAQEKKPRLPKKESEALPKEESEALQASKNEQKDKQTLEYEQAVKEARVQDLARVSSLIEHARSDVRIWEILQTEVFDRMRGLVELVNSKEVDAAMILAKPQLSEQKSSSSGSKSLALKKERKRQRNDNVKGKVQRKDAVRPEMNASNIFAVLLELQKGSGNPHPLAVLQTNYFQHILFATRTLRVRFPSSSYVQVMLDTIKEIHPISYVLGASTDLYNELLFITWRQHADVQGCADLVWDMWTNSVPGNSVTRAVFYDAFREMLLAKEAREDLKKEDADRARAERFSRSNLLEQEKTYATKLGVEEAHATKLDVEEGVPGGLQRVTPRAKPGKKEIKSVKKTKSTKGAKGTAVSVSQNVSPGVNSFFVSTSKIGHVRANWWALENIKASLTDWGRATQELRGNRALRNDSVTAGENRRVPFGREPRQFSDASYIPLEGIGEANAVDEGGQEQEQAQDLEQWERMPEDEFVVEPAMAATG